MISVLIVFRCVYVLGGLFVVVLLCVWDCWVSDCVKGKVPSVLSVEVVNIMRVAVNVVTLIRIVAAVWTKSVVIMLWANPDGFGH